MSYANLLVHIESDGSSSDRVQLASSLATRLWSKLIGLAAAAPLPPTANDAGIVDGALAEAERSEILAELTQLRERFHSLAALSNHPTEWRSAVDFPTELLVGSADLADLLIIGRTDPDRSTTPYRSVDAGDVLMRAGRPILLIPPGVRALDGRNVVVAWNATREARRAISDALPILSRAERRILVHVTDADAATARKQIADILSWFEAHGLPVAIDLHFDIGASIADEIVDVAANAGADLIVAGGYGHSRFREWVFGGVTRDLLRRCPICCLMAH